MNHITVALSGTNLIEASSGTGKTYAIASLYLRLLVEQELLPEQSRFLALKAEAGSLLSKEPAAAQEGSQCL